MAETKLENNTLQLAEPITFGSQEYHELHFKEPTGREMSLIKENMTYGDILQIASKLCGVPPRVMEQLKAKDVRKVVEHTSFLLADG
jgi:hypothetical protein